MKIPSNATINVKVPILWIRTGNLWDRFELIKRLKKLCSHISAMLLKHLHKEGRSTVDWSRWRHNTAAQRGPPAPRLCIGPRPTRDGAGVAQCCGLVRRNQIYKWNTITLPLM